MGTLILLRKVGAEFENQQFTNGLHHRRAKSIKEESILAELIKFVADLHLIYDDLSIPKANDFLTSGKHHLSYAEA